MPIIYFSVYDITVYKLLCHAEKSLQEKPLLIYLHEPNPINVSGKLYCENDLVLDNSNPRMLTHPYFSNLINIL